MVNMKQMTFEAIAIKGDVAYASDYNRNGLFKVNINTGQCEFIGLFEGELINKKRLHCSAIWIDSKVYFIPASANKITIYCLEDNHMEAIEIPLPDPKQFSFYKNQYKFIKGIRNGDDLWLIPSTYPGIIKLNIQNRSIQFFDEWLEDDDYFFRMGIVVEDKKIFVANGKNNSVLIFDMEKESGKIVHIGSNNNGVMSICKMGDNYWFAPRLPGAIVVWNPLKNEVTEYDKFPEGFEERDIVFSVVYCFDDKIIFVPGKSNRGLIYDNGSFQLDDFDIRDEFGQGTIEYLFETDTERFFRIIESTNNNKYFKINKIDNNLKKYSFLYYDDGERDRCMIAVMSMKCEIVKETVDVGLKELINGLV